MITMTGLDFMAPIQSKCSNIAGSFPRSLRLAALPARFELRRTPRRGSGQFAVLRIHRNVAIGIQRPHDLLGLLVVRGTARHRPEAERVLLVRRGRRALVLSHGFLLASLRFDHAAQPEEE